MGSSEEWSEGLIADALCRHTFQSKCLLLVDRCNWTGHECDVLAVTKDLRVIDIEIKITRSDVRADAKKDKWWHRQIVGHEKVEKTSPSGHSYAYNRPKYSNTPREWPPKVWKHYYAMPETVWDDSLLDSLPSSSSGIILLRDAEHPNPRCHRRAKPSRSATRLEPEQVMNIARLASLRMWDAYRRAADMRSMLSSDQND